MEWWACGYLPGHWSLRTLREHFRSSRMQQWNLPQHPCSLPHLPGHWKRHCLRFGPNRSSPVVSHLCCQRSLLYSASRRDFWARMRDQRSRLRESRALPCLRWPRLQQPGCEPLELARCPWIRCDERHHLVCDADRLYCGWGSVPETVLRRKWINVADVNGGWVTQWLSVWPRRCAMRQLNMCSSIRFPVTIIPYKIIATVSLQLAWISVFVTQRSEPRKVFGGWK